MENTTTMKLCTACKEEINKDAKKCPKCGEDLRNWFVRHYIVTAILVFIILGIAFAKSPEEKVKEVEDLKEQAKTMEIISPSQLSAEYAENTVSADQKIKGKRVKISGKIKDINTSIDSKPYVVMDNEQQYSFTNPQLRFHESIKNEEIAGLKKGEKLTISCVGDGDIAKTPMLKDCIILE